MGAVVVAAVCGIILGALLMGAFAMPYVFQLNREHNAELKGVYEKMIAYQGAHAQESIESVLRLATTGSPVATAAIVEDREPDPVDHMRQLVTEETIQNGMAQLREEYRKLGVAVDDDALRDEAVLFLSALEPPTPFTMPSA